MFYNNLPLEIKECILEKLDLITLSRYKITNKENKNIVNICFKSLIYPRRIL